MPWAATNGVPAASATSPGRPPGGGESPEPPASASLAGAPLLAGAMTVTTVAGMPSLSPEPELVAPFAPGWGVGAFSPAQVLVRSAQLGGVSAVTKAQIDC